MAGLKYQAKHNNSQFHNSWQFIRCNSNVVSICSMYYIYLDAAEMSLSRLSHYFRSVGVVRIGSVTRIPQSTIVR